MDNLNYLVISIGQAGNQINNELSNLFLNEENLNFFLTIQGDLAKNVLIDTEKKVISKYFKGENISKSKYYADDVNVITSSSGRGNNWALGYSLDYKEVKAKPNENNICIESFEKISKFLERCDFMKGFLTVHSLNGGTGSGVTSRIVEMLRDEYPKFTFVDCPVVGLNIENTTLSQFNKFFTICHLYENVDWFFLINNEKFKKMIINKQKFDFKSMNSAIAKLLYNFLISESKSRCDYSLSFAFPDLKFVDLVQYKLDYKLEDFSMDALNKLFSVNSGECGSHKRIASLDFNFSTNSNNFKSDPFYNKMIKEYTPKAFSQGRFVDKTLKNNILVMDAFVKNLDHKSVMKSLASSIEEKIKSR